MYEILIQPFIEYGFMFKSLLGCVLISLCAPMLGLFLILKKMSLTGDAISHAILPGVAIGYAVAGLSVTIMTLGGFIAGSLVIVLSGFVSRYTKKGEDSALAVFYLISLALGILIISLNGSNIDLLSILFGSLLTINDECLILLSSITLITIVTMLVIRRPFIIDCIDPDFLIHNDINGHLYHIIFMILVVLNLIAGFQTIGTLMAVGLLILPAAIIRLWINNIVLSCLISPLIVIISCYCGLIASFYYNYPTTPIIILALGLLYLISVFLGTNGGILWKYVRLKHLDS